MASGADEAEVDHAVPATEEATEHDPDCSLIETHIQHSMAVRSHLPRSPSCLRLKVILKGLSISSQRRRR